MKSNVLALPLITVLCICISATATISENAKHDYSRILTTTLAGDSVKTALEVSDSTSAAIEEAWTQWKTVENHTFGKDRGNLPMIADLHSLHPFFRDKIQQLIYRCRAKGIELAVVESYRTHAKQSEYYTMGRKYTRSTGGKSKHQYGLAVDVVPVVDSVAVWDNINLWKKIGVEGEKLGLRWGGRWRAPFDPAHFEWSGGLTTYQLAAGALPNIPKAYNQQYPCLHEDIQQLREYWDIWEDVQLALKRNRLKRAGVASSETP